MSQRNYERERNTILSSIVTVCEALEGAKRMVVSNEQALSKSLQRLRVLDGENGKSRDPICAPNP